MENILLRKSVRKFKDIYVDDSMVEKLLMAAMQAPSAGNSQPWEYIVIRDREIFSAIKKYHPYANSLLTCSFAILVCGNLNKERFKGYWVQDCSASIENILIAAQSLGLGAVWTGIYPEEDRIIKTRELFNLPDYVVPLAIIPVGVPDEDRKLVVRYNSDNIHYEKWENKKRNRIQVVAKHILEKNKTEEAVLLFKELVEKSKKEGGCLSYILHIDTENENIYTIIEEWENVESLENHFKTEHFKILSEKIKKYTVECTINKYKIIE